MGGLFPSTLLWISNGMICGQKGFLSGLVPLPLFLGAFSCARSIETCLHLSSLTPIYGPKDLCVRQILWSFVQKSQTESDRVGQREDAVDLLEEVQVD